MISTPAPVKTVARPALHALGWALLQQGKFDAAGEAFQQAMDSTGSSQENRISLAVLSSLAIDRALEGRLDEAQLLIGPRERTQRTALIDAQVIIDWLTGRYVDVTSFYLRKPPHPPDPSRDWLIPFVAISAAEIGDLELARRAVRDPTELYNRAEIPIIRHLFEWANGIIAWRGNRMAESAERLRRAASGLLHLGGLPFAAFVLFDFAEVAARLDMRKPLADVAMAQATIPLLCRALSAICPEAVPANTMSRLRRLFEANSLRSRFAAGQLLEVLDLFAAHDVPAIPIKDAPFVPH